MERSCTIKDLKERITPIAAQHGVKQVSLFGSRARHEEKVNSDVDLLIEKGKLVSLFDLSRFRLAAEDALELPVDLVTTDCSDLEFLNEISKESVLLYAEQEKE